MPQKAECERGFCAMNLQQTSTRSSLLIQTVRVLLINGPLLGFWPQSLWPLGSRRADMQQQTINW